MATFGFSIEYLIVSVALIRRAIPTIAYRSGAESEFAKLFASLESLEGTLDSITTVNQGTKVRRQALNTQLLECKLCIARFLFDVAKFRALCEKETTPRSLLTNFRRIKWEECETKAIRKFRREIKNQVAALYILLATFEIEALVLSNDIPQNRGNASGHDESTMLATSFRPSSSKALHGLRLIEGNDEVVATWRTNVLLEAQQWLRSGLSLEEQQELYRLLHVTVVERETFKLHPGTQYPTTSINSHVMEIKSSIRTQRRTPPQVLFQEPLILQDALGQVKSIRSEFIYSSKLFEATLQSGFPAAARSIHESFLPGQRIKMSVMFHSFLVGRCQRCRDPHIEELYGTFFCSRCFLVATDSMELCNWYLMGPTSFCARDQEPGKNKGLETIVDQVDEQKLGINSNLQDNTTGTETLKIEGTSDSDSDTGTIDEGPEKLPLGFDRDYELVKSRQWSKNLDSLEREVVTSSVFCNLFQQSQEPRLEDLMKLVDKAQKNLEAIIKSGYSKDGINALVQSETRPEVASLLPLSYQDFKIACLSVQAGDMGGCQSVLETLGLTRTFAKIRLLPEQYQFRSAAAVIAKFLDLAVVCFCCAHIERFDIKYLQEREEFKLWGPLKLRRRSLRCLDTHLHHRKVWVFDETHDTANSSPIDGLYLSTTIEELHKVWGPTWATLRASSNEMSSPPNVSMATILRYPLGRGWIVPWDRTPGEPTLLSNENFAHWTDKESDLDNDQAFPERSAGQLLLIGGTPKLLVNKLCQLDSEDWTAYMRSRMRLTVAGTQKDHKSRDSQTYTIGLSTFGVSATYQEQHKIRDGSTLKDRLIGKWSNQPGERNASIVADRLGIIVSACSENAKRERLARILGSYTIKNYLDSARFEWSQPETKKAYFDAMNDRDIRTFERLYYSSERNIRENLGEAVAWSLRGLLETGTDSNLSLHALWSPGPDKTWKATFSHGRYNWTGLLTDTINSCTVAVVTDKCLVIERLAEASRCQSSYRQEQDHFSTNSKNQEIWIDTNFPVLETAIVVNPSAPVSQGMQVEVNANGKETFWLHKNAEFDLGDSGRLKVVRCFCRSKGILMKWASETPTAEILQSIRQSFFRSEPRPCHWERIINEPCKIEPLAVHITP